MKIEIKTATEPTNAAERAEMQRRINNLLTDNHGRHVEIERAEFMRAEIRLVERMIYEIDVLWSLLDKRDREIGMRDGTISMACLRLGGLVEGNPPGAHNFIQRIDELRAIEKNCECGQ